MIELINRCRVLIFTCACSMISLSIHHIISIQVIVRASSYIYALSPPSGHDRPDLPYCTDTLLTVRHHLNKNKYIYLHLVNVWDLTLTRHDVTNDESLKWLQLDGSVWPNGIMLYMGTAWSPWPLHKPALFTSHQSQEMHNYSARSFFLSFMLVFILYTFFFQCRHLNMFLNEYTKELHKDKIYMCERQ